MCCLVLRDVAHIASTCIMSSLASHHPCIMSRSFHTYLTPCPSHLSPHHSFTLPLTHSLSHVHTLLSQHYGLSHACWRADAVLYYQSESYATVRVLEDGEATCTHVQRMCASISFESPYHVASHRIASHHITPHRITSHDMICHDMCTCQTSYGHDITSST